MKFNCWKKKKDKNPYHHGTWINTKKGLMTTIVSDIGFGKQRNVVIENYRNQKLSGYEVVKVGYHKNQKQALKFAKEYMGVNNKC